MADEPIDADLVGDEPEQSTNSLSEKIAKMYPIGRKPNPNRSQLLRAVWMSTIMLTIPFVAAMPLLNPEPETEVEEWYADWAVQSWSQQVDGSPAQGARVEAMVTVDHGGLLEANYTVEYLGTGGIGALVGCQQDWTVELRSPDPVNFSDGSNATSWSGENWEGSDRVIIDTPLPTIEASSSDELQEEIFTLRSDTNGWMYGKGEWILSLLNNGGGGTCTGSETSSFTINLTITNWREPRFADGDFNFTTSTVGGGTPIGTFVTLGGSVPLLLIAAAVTFGLRKSESDESEEENTEESEV